MDRVSRHGWLGWIAVRPATARKVGQSSFKVVSELDRLLRSPFVLVAIGLALGWVLWKTLALAFEATTALQGYSPFFYVYQAARPELFASDFPSGVEGFDKSVVMRAYRLLHTHLGVAPEVLAPWVLGLEVIALGWASAVLCRAAVPSAPPVVALLVSLLVAASTARNMSLANYYQPFYNAEYYNLTDAFRMLSVAAALRRQIVRCAQFLALTYLCHSTLGLMTTLVVATIVLAPPRKYSLGSVAVAGAVLVGVVGGWLCLSFRVDEISGSAFPAELWFTITRSLNFHWYPVANGVLTRDYYRAFLPLLSFVILWLATLPPRDQWKESDNRISIGAVAALLVAFAGLVISWWCPSTFLIKIGLHRVSDMVPMLALPVVVNALWVDMNRSTIVRRVTAGTLLFSSFFLAFPFPFLLVAFYVVIRILGKEVRRGLVTSSVAAVSLWLSAYYLLGFASPAHWVGWKVGGEAIVPLMVVLAGVNIVLWALRRHLGCDWTSLALVPLAICFAFQSAVRTRPSLSLLEHGRRFQEVQVWARESTPETALFWVDPGLDGWREFSRRSSFGGVREWLHSAWLYRSDYSRYEEGVRRFRLFEVPLEPYLHFKYPLDGGVQLVRDVRDRFYRFNDEKLVKIARMNGISYIVFLKERITERTRLRAVFENQDFLVVSTGS